MPGWLPETAGFVFGLSGLACQFFVRSRDIAAAGNLKKRPRTILFMTRGTAAATHEPPSIYTHNGCARAPTSAVLCPPHALCDGPFVVLYPRPRLQLVRAAFLLTAMTAMFQHAKYVFVQLLWLLRRQTSMRIIFAVAQLALLAPSLGDQQISLRLVWDSHSGTHYP